MSTARKLAFAATAATVVLALAPGVVAVVTGQGVEYDARVAILTTTAVAIIWYTSFTFEATDATRRMAEIMSRDAFQNLGADAEQLRQSLRNLHSRILRIAQSEPETFERSASRGQLKPPFDQNALRESRNLARGLPTNLRTEILAALRALDKVTAARRALIRSARLGGETLGKARDYQTAARRAEEVLADARQTLSSIVHAVGPEDIARNE